MSPGSETKHRTRTVTLVLTRPFILTLPLRQLSARPSGGSHPRSGKAACGFILAAAVARTAAGADPRNSRAGPRPSHHMRLLSRPPPRPPHPSPSHYVTPCECVCEVIARSTRDSLGTCEVCVQGNDWHRKNIHQCQAVSRVTRSSLRLLLDGAVVCCAAWKGTTRPTAAPR